MSSKKKVYITREIPEEAVIFLKKKGFDVTVNKNDRPVTKKELLTLLREADAVIPMLTDRFDKEVIDKITRCRVIANYAVGYNNIDVKYAREKGIIVTNTPDVLTDSTADLAMTLVLACTRRIFESQEMLRSGKYKGWKPKLLLGAELNNKVFGILGAGRIGTAVAKRAVAFGAKIIYYSNIKNSKIENEFNARRAGLSSLLKKADIISVHLPLTPETFRLIDAEKLKMMKKTAVLINTARGEIIDEKALIKTLKKGSIGCAGLDVFENEPKVNTELLKLKNVIVLPHIGSATKEARTGMAMLAAKNVASVLSGRKPVTPVYE